MTCAGAIILLSMMPAALVFNLPTRFFQPHLTPFLQTPGVEWQIIYDGTLVLLIMSELLGGWMAFQLLRGVDTLPSSLHRKAGYLLDSGT